MIIIEVTPPAAAALAAVAMVSRFSRPGSPVETRMSINPGAQMRPLASIILPSAIASGPKSTINPSSIRSVPSWS